MVILLAASLSIQTSEPTAEDTRTAMAWGACIASSARQLAGRPDPDAAVASAVVAACADLERGVAAASIRMAPREGGGEIVRRLHADAYQRALAGVRELRGAPPPTGPGAEFQVWGRCVDGHLVARADGPGTPEEIVQAAERDCAAEKEAAHAAAVRELGLARGGARMGQLQTQAHAFSLQLLAQIRESHRSSAPGRREPR